jgi:hypothetical protein
MTELTTADTSAMRREGTWREYLRTEMDRGRRSAAAPSLPPQAPKPDSAMDVPCPHCQAPAGRTCTTRSGRHGIAGLHTARQVAYAALARESA